MFTFRNTEGARDMQEITTAIRAIADVKQIEADTAKKQISLRGMPEQLALAEWLFNQLDEPAAPNSQDVAVHEYLMQGAGENDVRIFYFPNAVKIQDFQEAATAIRVVADIRRIFTYTASRTLIARGTGDQIDLAAWLVKQVNDPRSSTGNDYRLPASADRFDETDVHVFHVVHTDSIQSFQEIATSIRTVADIRRVFTYNASRTVLMRARADAVALAAWLFDQLDLPEPPAMGSSGNYEYPSKLDPDNIVRVFYLPRVASVQDFEQDAKNLRDTTRIRRVFTYTQPRAIVVRSTIDKINQAELILKSY